MRQLQNMDDAQLALMARESMTKKEFKAHTTRIDEDIKFLGAVKYDLLLPETHTLPYIVHPDERIIGIVYGRYKQQNGVEVGRGALVATNNRVMLVDKKPLFVRCDELTYRVVSGVNYSRVGPIGTVTLHTRMGDTTMRTFNQKCANSFVEAVEAEIFKHNGEREGIYDNPT